MGQQGPTPGISSSSGQDRSTGVTRLQPQPLLPPPAMTGLLGSAGANSWHFCLFQPGPVYWGQQVPTPGTSSSSCQDWSTGVSRGQPLALPHPPAGTGLLGSEATTPGTSSSSGQDRSTGVSRRNRWHFRLLRPGPVYRGQQGPTPGTSSSSGQDWSTGVCKRQPLALPPFPSRTGLVGSPGSARGHLPCRRRQMTSSAPPRLGRPPPATPGTSSFSGQDRSTGVSRRQPLAFSPASARTGLLGSAGPTPGISSSSGQDRSTGVSRRQPLALPPAPARTGLLGSAGANPWHILLLRPEPAPTPGTSVYSSQDRSTGVSRCQPLALPPPPARTGLLGSAGANPWHFRLLRPGPVYWGQQATTPCTSSSSSGQDWSIGVIRRQTLALPPAPARTGLPGSSTVVTRLQVQALLTIPARTGLLGSAGANPWHFLLLRPGLVYWGHQAPNPGTSDCSCQDRSTGVSRRQPLALPPPPARTGLLGSEATTPCTSSSSGQDRSTGISRSSGVCRRQRLALPTHLARTGLLRPAGANPWHFCRGPVNWGQHGIKLATSSSSGQERSTMERSTVVSRRQPLVLLPSPSRTGLVGSAGANVWHFLLIRPRLVYCGQQAPTPGTSVEDRSTRVSMGNPSHFLRLRPGLVYWGHLLRSPGSDPRHCPCYLHSM
ncbi:hypothetical protein JTE90_020507 [Oedothorax gibbosus]|uniref:Uncharacterized protein n=1 Tax=Oedothorax gibbosus TaxID=931172 RepID=A0AAV6URT2_9ARAC|nr:hypothetical protein JTE90_020507 [Oedothorax gibbosus]